MLFQGEKNKEKGETSYSSNFFTRPLNQPVSFQAQPKVFSAGLDILEMYGKNPEHYAEFWKSVQDMWLKLYGYRKITIAAINVSLLELSPNTKL